MTSAPASPAAAPFRWREAWIDFVGFAGGLGLAWYLKWETRDLVWSLWLSSLVVGYLLIVWTLVRPVFLAARAASAGGLVAGLLGGGFMLAFFTVHFGGFHLGHSVFLNAFFPVEPGVRGPSLALYAAVVARYWWFVPLALLAERQAFLAPAGPGKGLMQPYKNVVRLHLLIFFFAGAHFAQLDSFAVYAVVYAVYFFPWSLLRRPTSAA